MDKCILCKSSEKDDIQYGDFLKNKHFGVHTFCLYLSSNLSQNGQDDEGLLGFLEKDIRKEVQRVSKLKCYYCHKRYANIGCCEQKCRITFHLICGLQNFAENRFCKDFRSYCHRHARKTRQRPSSTETCLICYDNLCTSEKRFKSVNMILTPCCSNGWFHKLCLQKFAKTAGYFFKCPLCNDVNIFRQKLPARGIFIPNQDAAWELEPNAFSELLERPKTCSAMQCKNKKGPTDASDQNPFVYCRSCGSIAMHKYCLLPGLRSFYCNDCTVAAEEDDNINSEEDEYIEVCDISDDGEIVNNVTDITSSRHSTVSRSNKSIKSRSTSRTTTIVNSDEEQSDLEIIQPRKRNKHKSFIIVSDTETSENSEEDEMIKPSTSKYTKRQRIESDCQAIATNPLCTQINARIRTDSDNSEITFSCKTKRKRQIFSINSDTDEDEKQKTIPKQTRIDCKRTKHVKNKENENKSDSSNENSDDEDPLEHFEKYVKQQNTSNCIALRTRRQSQHFKQTSDLFSVKDIENKENQNKNNENSNTNGNNNNNIRACEGQKASRRKTFNTIIKEKPQLQTLNDKQQHLLDISCIARRTRRKTICAQTPLEHFKEHFEQSRIYDKLQESDNSTTDDESHSDTKTSINLHSNVNKLDVSCIANRTRRRKSLMLCREKIFEEPIVIDSSTSLTSSPASSTSFNTHLDSFYKTRKRYTRRVLSSSSEESNSNKNHLKFMSKMPQINIENYFTPKYAPLHNYHLSSRERERL